MKTLPVFYFKPTILCIDDNLQYVESLAKLLQNKYTTKVFTNVVELESELAQYESYLSAISFLRSLNESELGDSVLSSMVEFNLNKVINLMDNPKKYNEISVVIIDYMMPELNGIKLSQRLSNYKFKKFLLTGSQDYKAGIQALNSQDIDRFINKDSLGDYILETVNELSFEYFNDLTNPMRKHLESAYSLPISDSKFVNYLLEFMKNNKITEYYLIDKNGSLLLLNENNQKSVLIVHTDRSITEFIKVFLDDSKLESIVCDINSKRVIPWFGVDNTIKDMSYNAWSQNLYIPEVVLGEERYFIHHKLL